MSRFVVLGARGGTGLEIVRRLVERPQGEVAEVIAVVRDPSKVPADTMPADPRLQLVQGDVTNADSLRQHFQGAKAVFFAASGTSYDQCEAVDWKGVGLTADLVKETASGARVILVSSQLVHPTNRFNPIRGLLNTLVTGMFRRTGLMDFKFAGEQLLRKSGVEYCIVRPGQLGDAPLGQEKLLVAQTNGMFGKGGNPVGRADVAAVCVAAAFAPSCRSTTFELCSEKVAAENATQLSGDAEAFFKDLSQDWDKSWTDPLNEPAESRSRQCFRG